MSQTLELDQLDPIKQKQQATWSSGDYAVIGTTLQIVGETLCEAADISACEAVLDVAAGNGNASLAAARRGSRVTASDYVEALLDGAQQRAAAEGLALDTQVADAERMPFADDSFDAVLSTFGVMFTPNPDRAAGEMLRVCRPGGRIALANWTPTGFIGRMFKIVGAHVPPPEGVPSPLLWGTEDRARELLGAGGQVDATVRQYVFRYRDADDFFDTFRTYYGPVLRAWGALDDSGRDSFRTQLVALTNECNVSTRGALAVPSDYLEIVAHVG